MHFILKKNSLLIREKLFSVSTDIENFPTLMPRHFKDIVITKSVDGELFVDEKINFLGYFLDVKTKHVIVHPGIHEVHMLSGLMNGSSFVESYDKTSDGTLVTIDVSIVLNGASKILSPFGFLIKRQMTKVMVEFLNSAEKQVSESNDH